MDRVTEVYTVGALLFGGLVASILYGVTSMQTVTYYQRKREDKWFIRVAVPVLWVLGTIDMGLIFHFLYYYLIRNYGKFDSVTAKLPVQSMNIHFFVIAITQSTVRSLCAVRIRTLCQSWLPTIPIYVLTLVDFGSNLTLTIKGAHEQSKGIGSFGTAFNVIVCVEFAVSTAGDALVALCLCYLLRRARTRVRSTESMINIIVAYLITTGLLTTLVQTSALVFFLLSSRNFIYLAVLTQVSKLYVNAYLALLNDRARIRDRSTLNPASITPSRVQTAVSLVNLAPNRSDKSHRESQSTAADAHLIDKRSISIREPESDTLYGHAV